MLFVSSVLDINQSLLYCLYIRLRVPQVAHLTLLHDYNCLISGQIEWSSPRDSQGHPMDLFLKIFVLHANFCWLGDVEEIIVLGRKVLLGKR